MRLKEACPDAKITTSIGEGGKQKTSCNIKKHMSTNIILYHFYFYIECWEFFLNDKCVHSRKLLYGSKFPDMDEMIEISLQMNEVSKTRSKTSD